MTSAEQRLEQLEKRLAELENLESIRRLLARYCKALDERNLELMAPLWGREAVLLVQPWGYEFTGSEAIVRFYSDYFKGPWIGPRHNCANEYIERDGEEYASFSYFHETLARDDLSVIGWGTWLDRFCCEDSVWKFSRREINVLALTPITKGWAMADKIMSLA